MDRISFQDYLYPVSRIRVLEKYFLDRQTYARLLEQRRVEDAMKILLDLGFGEKSRDYGKDGGYEALLSDEYDKVFRTVYDLAPQKELFDSFLLKNDYHNIKVIVKSELLQKRHEGLLLDSGSIPPETMETAVRERRFAALSADMEAAVLESFERFAQTQDPQVVDMICDQMEYREVARRAELVSSQFVRELLSMRADFANLKSFLRVRKAGQGADFLRAALVDGGQIKKETFIGNLGSSPDAFLAAVTACPYLDAIREAVGRFGETERFGGMEKVLDDHMMTFIQQARRVSFGPEVLIAYLMARENEIKNARIILGGIESGASPAVLSERLREQYV